MFNVGDWIWGIDEYEKSKHIVYAMIIAKAGEFYICAEQVNENDNKKTFQEIIESMYAHYIDTRLLSWEYMILLRKENTFATEQEAREVLEVIG